MCQHASHVDRQHAQQLILRGSQLHRPARNRNLALVVADGQFSVDKRLGPCHASHGGPHPGHQLRRREGLDNIVGRARIERPDDRFVPAVGGDEDDGQVCQLRNLLHQRDAIRPGEEQVQQDQSGLVHCEEAGHLLRVPGHDRGVAGPAQLVPQVPKHLGVVVDHQDARLLALWPNCPRASRCETCGGGFALLGHGHREGESRTAPHTVAFGPDSAPVRLHQALADGQAEPGPRFAALPDSARRRRVPAEQVRQSIRGHTAPLVAHRDRHMHAFSLCADPNGRRYGRVSCRVGQQVVQDLDDARPVGHHPRQVFRQVNVEVVRSRTGHKRAARLVDQGGDLHRLGRHRQCAGHDAPVVEQFADHAAHAVGLVVDDAEELQHLVRVRPRRGAQNGGRGALDRDQRRSQLVAHDAKELGAHALHFLQRPQVLQRDDDPQDRAIVRLDRRRVDQGGYASAIGERKRDLLRAHSFARAQELSQRKLGQGDLSPVRATTGDRLQQLRRSVPGYA